MNTVMIVPTGLGCEIGGHAGDANPAAKLLGECSDKLILHPNVVNASDINEMPPNALYVEGSILARFLEGSIGLREVTTSCNRVLVAINTPVGAETVNAISAARATIGMSAKIITLDTPLRLIANREFTGIASGLVLGWKELVSQVNNFEFDALAIASLIEIDYDVAADYLQHGGVNPWGGVEAEASSLIATAVNKPVAHAPIESGMMKDWNVIVDPRMAAEMVSRCYIHSVLKGLHRAPRVVEIHDRPSITVNDIDCLVTPVGCIGRPHMACLAQGIPIIAVEENSCCLNERSDRFIYVKSYLEAAGLIMAMRAGVSLPSLKRPLPKTIVY